MSTELATVSPAPVSTLGEQMEYAKVLATGSLVPKEYKDQPANVLIAIGLGRSMGLTEAESLYRISVINGRPTAGAELIAANVRKAGHKLRVTSTADSATCQIVRADDPDFVFEVTRDLQWAKSMGLAGKENYQKQGKTMLEWRAITACARLACPEALYGVAFTPDEMLDSAHTASAQSQGHPKAKLQAVLAKPDDEIVEAVPIETGEAPTKTQLDTMWALLGPQIAGMDKPTAAEVGLGIISAVIGHEVQSTQELSGAQVAQVIAALEAEAAA